MKKQLFIYFSILVTAAAVFIACKPDEELPDNPYDDIDYPNPPSPTNPDPNTIAGIHKNILQVKCNNPGCHDGSFEPDFRTVQSSWRTLVYHKIVKNTADSAYDYRVLPYDTSNSMLIHRLTTGDAALQQMPATGDYLSASELNNIVTWINNGARDMLGNVGTLPNNEPQMIGYLAMDSVFAILDTNRKDDIYFNPFVVNAGQNFTLYFLLEDDSTAVNALTNNKVKLSTDKDDYAGATVKPAFYLSLLGYNVWTVSVNAGAYAPGTTVYFRYYCNDGDHTADTEFPRTDMQDGYKTYFAFYIQ